MSDYIKRADAKRLISESCNECLKSCAEFDGIYPDCDNCLLHGVKSKLQNIPAADVRENVRGEWVQAAVCKHKPYRIRDTDKWTTYKCSNCGYSNGRRFNTNFCPNCGADMRGENDGNSI